MRGNLYYAMVMTGNCATRVGRMGSNPDSAIRIAAKRQGGYVEQLGVGVIWTPEMDSKLALPRKRQH